MLSSRTLLSLLALSLLGSTAVQAHDFWVAPSAFQPAKGQRLTLQIEVGDQFAGERLARSPELIERFQSLAPGQELGEAKPVVGIDGRAPAGYLRPQESGLHWVALTTNPVALTLPSIQFETYLEEEGLQAVRRERQRRGEGLAPGRERYSRCAKAALTVDGDRSGDWSLAWGLPLELVLDGDPAALAPEERLGVRVLASGKPVAKVLVTAIEAGDPERVLAARTDEHGRVRLPIEAGTWLISAVHMTRDTDQADSDWRSHWASLTFAVPSAD